MSFSIKNGDTAPSYVFDLQDDPLGTAAAIDLTDATSVRMKMRLTKTNGAPALDAAMTVTDAVNGRVTYDWQAGDTDVPGTYDVEFEIHWSDGTIETVPNSGYKTVVVTDDLDD